MKMTPEPIPRMGRVSFILNCTASTPWGKSCIGPNDIVESVDRTCFFTTACVVRILVLVNASFD